MDRKAQLEKQAEELVAGSPNKCRWFDPYLEAPLWLACHRLKNKGVLKEGMVSNTFLPAGKSAFDTRQT